LSRGQEKSGLESLTKDYSFVRKEVEEVYTFTVCWNNVRSDECRESFRRVEKDARGQNSTKLFGEQ